MRIGGVSVGKVKALELAPVDERVNGQDATRVEIEIEPEFAPIAEDARAILRLKTLLGETYVELTSGSEPTDELGSRLARRRRQRLRRRGRLGRDDPRGRPPRQLPDRGGDADRRDLQRPRRGDESSFQRWQANAAVAVQGRGLDLNDSFGNLGPFISDSSAVLDHPEPPEGGAAGAGQRYRRRLRGADRARPGPRRRDHELESDLRRARLAGAGAARRSSRSCPPSSGSRAPRSRASTSSRRTRDRSSRT